MSSSNSTPESTIPRLRARRACDHCRGRKTRCMVLNGAASCTSCESDQVLCNIDLEKYYRYQCRRAKRLARDINDQGRLGYIGAKATDIAVKLENAYGQQDPDHRSPGVILSASHPGAPLEPKFSTFVPLPSYIRQLPGPTNVDSLESLAVQGAFLLPQADSQLALLRSFVQHVHSDMPLLDLRALLDGIVLQDGQQVGLLLFQAVMFAGAIFVDHAHLHLMGYQTRGEALKSLFSRARALYEYGYEAKEVEIIQALLLFTLYQEDSQFGPSLWMSKLWAISRTTELQQRNEVLGSGQGLWRRLWWSMYTRDRVIALDTKQPMFIGNADHDVPMLLLADFESCYATGEIYMHLGLDYTLQDIATKTALALTFIYKAKLCQYIGRILTTQYSVEPASTGAAMYKPRPTGLTSPEFQDLDRELDVWRASLPIPGHTPMPVLPPRSQAQDIIHVQRSILQMLFFTAAHLLHRPSLYLPLSVDPLDGIFRGLSAWKIESASRNIIAITYSLHIQNMTDCLPDLAVTSLLSAAISYAVDPGPQVSLALHPSAYYLQQARDCLRSLKERYKAAHSAEAFLNRAASLLQPIEIPLPPPPESDELELGDSLGLDYFQSCTFDGDPTPYSARY
ncbi:hypothetical protein BJY01DRAFT_214116 [Aspergillus pseudoustus]|uniref:Zn(2)-C6 fungal-type domain-containing protein n=1 Tax=Aspergillus pseudoustus TaxID=1810923 RepID=A0ABR4JZH0_9EURO